MPLAVEFYDFVKSLHILAVVAALGPTFAYPVVLAAFRRRSPGSLGSAYAALNYVTTRLVSPGLGVVIVLGAYLATDRDLWSEPWVSGSFVLALLIGAVAGIVLSPAERRLADDPQDAAALNRLRIGGTLASALVAATVILMTTKLGA